MQSPKIGMIKLHLFLQKRVFTARAMIMYMYLSIYMYSIMFSSFANNSTDIMHLNQHARPDVIAYVEIDDKIMKYVKSNTNPRTVTLTPKKLLQNVFSKLVCII